MNPERRTVNKVGKMAEKQKEFLIVDDEPDICWAIENILKKIGLLSEKALNGREALQLVEQKRFRMAFLDAKLPDMEGLELARQIRKIDSGVRAVIVSGYFYKDDINIQNALKEDVICSFISKPFDHDEILKVIDKVSVRSKV
jgi:DNA-binding NtrC family response regulator